MNLLLKEPVTRVKKALNIFDKSLEIIELNSTARTALEAANALNCEVGAIVKSLVFRAEDNFILCLVSGDKKCSLNKLKKITQKKLIEKLVLLDLTPPNCSLRDTMVVISFLLVVSVT